MRFSKCRIGNHWRPLPGTRDLLHEAGAEKNLQWVVRALQRIPQRCARFVKLSNRGAHEFDVSLWFDGGRKFDGFQGHFALRNGKELRSECFVPPQRREIGAIGQTRKAGMPYQI
jgi:hypothetical protein